MDIGWSSGRVFLALTLLSSVHATGKSLLMQSRAEAIPTCACKSPNPMLDTKAVMSGAVKNKNSTNYTAKANSDPAVAGGPSSSSAVEVLTISPNLALQVRSSSASLAANIAKMMHIPVSRVSVTPWSWTPDQGNKEKLAFVQEEHERCDCQNADGTVVKGQGFRKVGSSTDSDGLKLAADTEIMTVTQFNALKKDEEERTAAGESEPSPTKAARIQLLSHDPCLVTDLIANTRSYAEAIATYLGLPEKSVLVQPPAVKGTVGLLQVDTASAQKNVSLLGVQRCLLQLPLGAKQVKPPKKPLQKVKAPAKPLKKVMPPKKPLQKGMPTKVAPKPQSAWKSIKPKAVPLPSFAPAPATPSQAPAPAVIPSTAPAPALAPSPPPSSQRVTVPLEFVHVHYDVLMMNHRWVSAFQDLVKKGVAAAAAIPYYQTFTADNVTLALYPGPPGSMLGEASIEVVLGAKPAAATAQKTASAAVSFHESATTPVTAAKVAAALKGAVGKELVMRLHAEQKKNGTAFKHFTHGAVNCIAKEPSIGKVQVAGETAKETNRAWLAPWSIVIVPPFSKVGATRLVEDLSIKGSRLAELLPKTSAYVPGIPDPALGAWNSAKEMRLPPPNAKYLEVMQPGVRLDEKDASNLEELVAQKGFAMKRTMELKRRAKDTYETMQAKKAIQAAASTQKMIKQAGAQFLKAARAHAAALTAPTRHKGLNIVPPALGNSDSPYPLDFSLAQTSSHLRRARRV